MTSTLNTPQQLWRTEFNKQATGKTMETVHKYAAAITRRVEMHVRKRDPLSIDERVQAAILGTLEGRLTWDPARIDLARHLMSAIKTAITNDLRHAKRFPEVSIDDDAVNQDDIDAQVTDVLAAQREPKQDGATATQLSESLAQLRVLAAQDKAVLLIIEAYGNGYLEKADVMNVTGISARTYHNARQRLVRLAKKLPIDIRDNNPIQPIA
jgi:hypothetical protein